MEQQSESLTSNQTFRDSIRGCMRWVLIFNICKLVAGIGAVIVAIISWVNLDASDPYNPDDKASINRIYLILPCIGAAWVSS